MATFLGDCVELRSPYRASQSRFRDGRNPSAPAKPSRDRLRATSNSVPGPTALASARPFVPKEVFPELRSTTLLSSHIQCGWALPSSCPSLRSDSERSKSSPQTHRTSRSNPKAVAVTDCAALRPSLGASRSLACMEVAVMATTRRRPQMRETQEISRKASYQCARIFQYFYEKVKECTSKTEKSPESQATLPGDCVELRSPPLKAPPEATYRSSDGAEENGAFVSPTTSIGTSTPRMVQGFAVQV